MGLDEGRGKIRVTPGYKFPPTHMVVRQAITAPIADQARTIRIPVT